MEVAGMKGWMTKGLAVTPGVVISTAVTCMVGAVLPAPVALLVFVGGLLAAGVLAVGAAEEAAARILVFSRPVSPAEVDSLAGTLTLLCRAGLGPPVVQLRVRAGEKAIAAGGFGRHTVVLSSGLLEAIEDGSLPDEQAAAVIAHAAGLVRGALVRQDPVFAFWTLPWQLLRAVCQAISSAGARLPLTSLAWRLRIVVIGIAVVQCLAQYQLGLAVTIGCIGVVSYAMPVWERRWQTMLTDRGDDAVDGAGLGPALALFLRRCPRTVSVRRRLHRLESGTRPAPALGLVR
jgi:Zn-dependent protease with chaperone function